MGSRKRNIALFLGLAVLGVCLTGCGGRAAGENGAEENSGITEDNFSGQEAKDLTADITAKEQKDSYSADAEYGSMRQFAWNLFAQVREEKNPVLSPLSAYLALSLAGEGAEDETEQEFASTMGENRGELCGSLMKSLPADKENITVKLANSAWVDEKLNIKETWLDAAKNVYASQVFQEELATEKTKRSINWWVEENTGGLIKNFLSKPLDKECRLALFNTVYFKGKWVTPFEAVDTYERPFTLDGGNVVNVATMNLYRKHLDYFKTDTFEGILLPYRDSSLVFAALKPVSGAAGIRQLYDQMDPSVFFGAFADASSTEVNLHLPKFEVSFDRKLNEALIKMGLVRAFDANLASFSGLGATADQERIYIDTVRQKAVFILDEEGTEAAAVTEVQMFGATAMREETRPVEVDFNEPFMYMVFDLKSGVPLFAGIMDDPAQAENKN